MNKTIPDGLCNSKCILKGGRHLKYVLTLPENYNGYNLATCKLILYCQNFVAFWFCQQEAEVP